MGFTITNKNVKVLDGRGEVDYVRYLIRSKSDHAFMELWFGPSALSDTPNNGLIERSSDFTTVSMHLPDGSALGVDSRGRLKTGGNWRWTTVPGQGGAIYYDVPTVDLPLFGKIVDSICYTPFPSQSK